MGFNSITFAAYQRRRRNCSYCAFAFFSSFVRWCSLRLGHDFGFVIEPFDELFELRVMFTSLQ
jgi:hypothetical protein